MDSQPKSSGLVLGRRPLGAILHSSNELGEVSQWLCHDDSTINIVMLIIIIIIIIIIIGRGQCLPPDHKLARNWASPAARDLISKFWEPLNISQTGKATTFKLGMHIGREQFLPPDHKLALSIQVKLKIASKEDHDSGVDP